MTAAEDGLGVSPPSSSVASSGPTWSKIVHPGVNACDGWPRCRYEGTGHDLRDHRRHCAYSDTGALWRLFHQGAGR